MIYNFGVAFPVLGKQIENIYLSQLKDIKVLELASVLAGPGAGQFFAELGAEVIKVENLSTLGDVTRSWKSAGEQTDDRSAYFCSVNWGKQSIGVNLTTGEGREIVQKLASHSDIVIASYKPGDAEKLGVDYQTLSAHHPELIYGQITGYGSDNARVGYDAIIQAESGFMHLNGEPGGRSLKIPVALMDILASHHLKEGILLAMLERAASGKGQLVEVSLIQAAVASLANQATNYLIAGKMPAKQGSAHPNIAPYGDVFITADGKELLLAIGTDHQFGILSNILKITDISNDFRYKTNEMRVRNRASLYPLLAEKIAEWQSEALLGRCHDSLVPAGLIRNIKDALEQPEIQGLLLSSGSFRGIKTFAVTRNRSSPPHFLPPPKFGEHTRTILDRVLQIDPTHLQILYQKGIVA